MLAGILVPQANLAWLMRLRTLGGVLFILGLILRWYSIIYLGQIFTVNVTIAADHRVIDTGPYRFVRHPSYSGSLLEFLGFGIIFGNWLSLVLLVLPVGLAFAAASRSRAGAGGALGEAYLRYIARAERLIPGVY